jgi:hypothetical protein
MKQIYSLFSFILLLAFWQQAFGQNDKYLFEKINSSYSNVHFKNEITDSLSMSKLSYIYIANSSGSGVADLNNDGRVDIFFSSNKGENKLYLNEGNFKFKDVTDKSSVKGNGKWGTGVCIIDINGDGLLDIYICHSGDYDDVESLCNEAFICTGIDAEGIPHYVDKAKELGLDLPGTQTTQVAFFDYDRDGDLDCFVLNHSKNAHGERLQKQDFLPDNNTKFIAYNMLLRNDFTNQKQHYTDVTKQAGIINSMRNFGLGVVISDVNNDGWPDIYATSDFAERDFLYLNNHDGTFSETARSSFRHIPYSSMGTDAADINNDLKPDIMTVDMLPEDSYGIKMYIRAENNDQFDMMLKLGLFFQYPKNTLQLNIGNDNGIPKFADIAQIGGMSNTNWSWSPLFVDVNNDGWKDLFVSNGYYRDYTNQDVQNKYITNKLGNMSYGAKKLNSCLFINNGSLSFTCVDSWKKSDPQISYSACIADFDNDGNVDILINNLNDEISLLKNVHRSAGNFINIKLKENDKNTFAIGAKVYVTCNHQAQMQEMQNVRGYQSSQDYVLHFGLGHTNDSVHIKVIWPDGFETYRTVLPNSTVSITKDKQAKPALAEGSISRFRFSKNDRVFIDSPGHIENKFNDFKVQFTIPYKQSQNGPGVAEGDINKDGKTDYYIGGSTGGERYFLLSQSDGTYKKNTPQSLMSDSLYEDVAAVFFDIDGDGDLDLLVVSGGVEHPENPEFLTDRVYRNNGNIDFEKIPDVFPQTNISKSCVAVGDYDGDGKPDLFIGGYTVPGDFIKKPQSFIYKNQSDGKMVKFKDVTTEVLPHNDIGMVTSASWVDLNDDKLPELVITGEWMSCKILYNKKGVLKYDKGKSGFENLLGMHEVIYPTDYNEDGKIDFIVGNEGDNNQFKATREKPMKIFEIKDTANKINSYLFSYYFKDREAFSAPRNEMLHQFVPYRKIFTDFSSYASLDVKGFFAKVGLPMPAPVMQCTNLLSGVYINKGENAYEFVPFPEIMQISRISTIGEVDWNYDGRKDYILSGNFYGYKNQFGPCDGISAYILENEGNGKYRVVMPEESGLFISGQVKKICVTQTADKCRVLFVRNNDKICVYDNNKN